MEWIERQQVLIACDDGHTFAGQRGRQHRVVVSVSASWLISASGTTSVNVANNFTTRIQRMLAKFPFEDLAKLVQQWLRTRLRRAGARSARGDRCRCHARSAQRPGHWCRAAASRHPSEHVLVGVDALRLSGSHHALPQPAEPAREDEAIERLTKNVAARDPFLLAILSSSRRMPFGRLIVTVFS